MNLTKTKTQIRRISPADGACFFGYYDLQPFDKTGKLHLAHRAPFADRLQKRGDSVEIGVIELCSGKYHALSSSRAWNFQQGCMLQWNPRCPDREIIYNDYINGEYVTVILDIRNGNKRTLPRPVANVSRDGKYGLGINFSRLYDFRPGYGYACERDKLFSENHPQNDGVWLVDMESGKARLVLSLAELWEMTGGFFDGERKLNINHITFNPDASRFVLLLRNFRTDENPHKTAAVTANRDGSDKFLLFDYGYISHYYWMDNKNMVTFATVPEISEDARNYILTDKTKNAVLFDENEFFEDNHMSFSPDMRYMLNDTYPDGLGEQSLYVYDTQTRENILLGKFAAAPVDVIDIRCDLHPRWNRDGSAVSFDSTHEGFRGIYIAEGVQ